MNFEGFHHITAITGDAPGNVDFYTPVLGLHVVKKTLNQDAPSVYHLFYADEAGSAGADLTFFEYPGVERGRAGTGMVHRIVWRIASPEALEFWQGRLSGEGIAVTREPAGLRFEDPEGLELELRVVNATDPPLVARHPDIPADLALQGFDGVRAYSTDPARSRKFLQETLGFFARGDAEFEVRGERRGSLYASARATTHGVSGAGTVHHVAWSSQVDDHAAWRERVLRDGGRPTPIVERFYFRSIYFGEPSGVLFEIATIGPGFAIDEPADRLGEALSLPPKFEHLRAQLERILTPLPNTRETHAADKTTE